MASSSARVRRPLRPEVTFFSPYLGDTGSERTLQNGKLLKPDPLLRHLSRGPRQSSTALTAAGGSFVAWESINGIRIFARYDFVDPRGVGGEGPFIKVNGSCKLQQQVAYDSQAIYFNGYLTLPGYNPIDEISMAAWRELMVMIGTVWQ